MSQQMTNSNLKPVKIILSLLGWLLTCTVIIVCYYFIRRPDLQWWEGVFTHGDATRWTAALTFDDGPDPLIAPLLADTLERHGAHGTFMLVGVQAMRFPELVARLVRGGHQIACHSLTHPEPNLTVLSTAETRKEIIEGTRVLEQLTGGPVRDFRPPGGGVDHDIIQILDEQGLRMAWWSANMGDFTSPPPRVIRCRMAGALRPGAVLLMHERANTVEALEVFLSYPSRSAYRFERFDEVAIRP